MIRMIACIRVSVTDTYQFSLISSKSMVLPIFFQIIKHIKAGQSEQTGTDRFSNHLSDHQGTVQRLIHDMTLENPRGTCPFPLRQVPAGIQFFPFFTGCLFLLDNLGQPSRHVYAAGGSVGQGVGDAASVSDKEKALMEGL